MKVLCFNQSFFPSSVVFGDEKGIIFSLVLVPPDNNPNNLLFLASKMFDTLGITISEIEGVSVVYGPGSFTGTRIGVVDAKIVAYWLGVPLYAINSLEFIATHFEGTAYAVIPAGRREYFGALFSNKERINDDRLLNKDDLCKLNSVVISTYDNVKNDFSGEFVKINLQPAKLLEMTLKRAENGDFVDDVLSLSPKYLHAVDVIFKKANR